MEDPDFAENDGERRLMERRIGFYERCGFTLLRFRLAAGPWKLCCMASDPRREEKIRRLYQERWSPSVVTAEKRKKQDSSPGGLLSCFLLCGAGSQSGSDALVVGVLLAALEDDDPPAGEAILLQNMLHPAVLQAGVEPQIGDAPLPAALRRQVKEHPGQAPSPAPGIERQPPQLRHRARHRASCRR